MPFRKSGLGCSRPFALLPRTDRSLNSGAGRVSMSSDNWFLVAAGILAGAGGDRNLCGLSKRVIRGGGCRARRCKREEPGHGADGATGARRRGPVSPEVKSSNVAHVAVAGPAILQLSHHPKRSIALQMFRVTDLSVFALLGKMGYRYAQGKAICKVREQIMNPGKEVFE